jgi:hypothetical protein
MQRFVTGLVATHLVARREIDRNEYDSTWNLTLDADGVLVADRVKIEADSPAVELVRVFASSAFQGLENSGRPAPRMTGSPQLVRESWEYIQTGSRRPALSLS